MAGVVAGLRRVTARTTPPAGTPSPRRDWLLRVPAAIGAGVALYFSFPPYQFWWLAPIAIAVYGLVLHERSKRAATGYSLLFALSFFLLHLLWLQDFLGRDLGPWPWLGLSLVMALYLTAAGALMPLVARLPAAPVWLALLFVLSEAVRGRFPYGGFPWGKLAFGQVEGPLLGLAALGGVPLVSFAVALLGFSLSALILRARTTVSARGWVGLAIPVVLPVVAALAAWPLVGVEAQTGTRTIAVVQGNAPDVGIRLLGELPTIRRNHLQTSRELAAAIRAGTSPKPDLVVWPESTTGFNGPDPTIDAAVAELGVPTLIGGLYRVPAGQENAYVSWDPVTGQGPRYVKQQLVPFSEFIPLREIARLFSPFTDNADLIAGTRPGVLTAAGTPLGVAICYEVAYDYVLRENVDNGAQLLIVPTNNAWFGRGDMTYQQLAMARLRAVEHGRAVVVAATSGVSATIRPDGTVLRSLDMYTPGTLTETLPLRTSTTIADRLGRWTEIAMVLLALLAVAAGIRRGVRERRAD
ncbi:apolipoprotein N-acyltransferase [Crossiella cryophila]|uniref:Apolipoprotein N-acyltransferase n=1 Tax=Crossiella cryophila TaxID=43355 RepID=A0A7W7CFK4_9PSEU|nr:apolipoprotein N-acyltransferase [Crossiella cryophila]MBB4680264.1 apolipoprotein N-acyltransferase [Crossiella cryophila]